MLKSFFIAILFLILPIGIWSQTGSIQVDTVKAKIATGVTPTKSLFYFTGSYINSNRVFEDNSIFQSLGKRYDEIGITTFGIGVGTYISLANHLDLELGLSYVLQGEQYTFNDSLSDSTFHYVNKYRHIGFPLRLQVSIGNGSFKGLVVGGVVPSSIISIKHESEYTNYQGLKIENDTKTITNDLASFNVVSSLSIGFSYKQGQTGVIVLPEFRYNLLNTYSGVPIKHNLWSWGINFGIIRDF